MLYTMKNACDETGMNYETLKYYCNEGLVPNVKRDQNNHRIFDHHDIAWIKDLTCLKRCNMSIEEMKEYLQNCLAGPSTISIRQKFLSQKRELLLQEIDILKESVAYIDWKQQLYDDVKSGKIPYKSNLIKTENEV